jgi:hypothetical protein
MRCCSKNIAFGGFVLTITAVAWLLLDIRNARNNVEYNSRVAVNETRIYMNTIETGIEYEALFNRRFFSSLPVHSTNVSSVVMHSFLLNTQYPTYYKDYAARSGKKFPDAWYNEIHFRIEASGVKLTNQNVVPVTIVEWSDGPNGRDEGGSGDDVVNAFNLNISAESVHK